MSDFLARFYPGDAAAVGVAAVLLQITVVIALAAAAARLAKRTAALRHAFWLAALGCVLVSPLVAVLAGRLGVGLVRIESPSARPPVMAEPIGPWAGTLTAPPRTAPADQAAASRPEGETLKPPAPADAVSAALSERSASIQAPIVSKVPDATGQAGLWHAIVGLLVLGWAVGAAFLLLRLLHGLHGLARLRRGARPLDAPRRVAVLESVRRALGAEKLPPIRTSPLARGPAAVGVLVPFVLLPEGTAEALDDRQLRDVLIHECAHLLRRDPLVGLLQRLAGALFWLHPLLIVLNRRLARAREEVCDDYVLRTGDAPAYARALLTLAEGGVCRPVAAAGLFDPNWKLEDRVAGLLDPRRTPMTRVPLWTFAGLAAALLAVCTAGAVVCAGGQPAKDEKPTPQEARAADPAPDPSKARIEGVVVDEDGKPVAGATVRVISYQPPPEMAPAHTAADGSFRLLVDKGFAQREVVTASVEDGARQGIYKDENKPDSPAAKARIVLKPSRKLAVRVTDAARAPVEGAAVGVLDYYLLLAQAVTDAHGMASLRLPRDAHVYQVVALKPGSGCDYFENYRSRNSSILGAPPAEVALTLDGARSLSVRAVDSADKALPGVDVAPWMVQKRDKITYFTCVPGLKYVAARTDRDGRAVFDWLPTEVRYPVEVLSLAKQYRQLQDAREDLTNPSKPAVLRLFRDVRISGKVTLPDGKPAADVPLQIEGHGDTIFPFGDMVRTKADGSYSMLVYPNLSYILAVTDEHWAAPSKTGIVVKEGEPRTGLDFRLDKGTILRGKVTTGPHDRAAAKKWINVVEQGGVLRADLGGDGTKRSEFRRRTETDADGRYAIRVGAGSYVLAYLEAPSHRKEITVKSEETIETDLKIDSLNTGVLKGLVLAGGLDGKPVREAFVKGESEIQGAFNFGSFEHDADEQGRFEVDRLRVKASVYARNPAGTLATIVTVGEDDDKATILLIDAGRIKGRLVDASGKPVAGMRVDWLLLMGPTTEANPRASLAATTDDAGRFTLLGVVPGAECQISVVPGARIQHLKDLPMTKVETLDVGDLVCDPKE